MTCTSVMYSSGIVNRTMLPFGGACWIRTNDQCFCTDAPLAGEYLRPLGQRSSNLVESDGFEPPCPGGTDLQSAAFSHSANSPNSIHNLNTISRKCQGKIFRTTWQEHSDLNLIAKYSHNSAPRGHIAAIGLAVLI